VDPPEREEIADLNRWRAMKKASGSSGSEKRQRQHAVAVRLLPAEKEALDAAAERLGRSASSYLRMVALGNAGLRSVRRPPVEKAELVRLLAAVGKIGSNVNQLAHIANSTGRIPEQEQIAATRAEVMNIRDALFAALGRKP
jgi:hypothetical protein